MKILAWILACLSMSASALELSNGTEIPHEQFGAEGDRIVWIPSEYGLRGDNHRKLARGIAEQGFEVWLMDVLGGYFLSPGRSSLLKVPLDDMVELIRLTQPEDKQLFLLTAGRGAALTLMAVRQWQQENPQHQALGGVLLLNPNLLAAPPQPGEAAQYLSIATTTNAPIFILQPKNSAKYWYLRDLENMLGEGGSSVFSLPLKNATDGYHVREDATDIEKKLALKLPTQLKSGVKFLNHYNKTPRQATNTDDSKNKPAWRADMHEPDLMPYHAAPADLKLRDLDGTLHDLSTYKGQVVLLNFWATWCPPCVEEIPSLGRLQALFEDKPFRILSVNVGEPEAKVRAFLAQVPAAFSILLDPEGTAVKPWQLRAFPLTFLLDKHGQIRYGYFGALEWDKPAIKAKVGALLDE
jgi:thiol-disulfide isomerase/thioredoxin